MRILEYEGRSADGKSQFSVSAMLPDDDPTTIEDIQSNAAKGITIYDKQTGKKAANAPASSGLFGLGIGPL